MSAFGIIVVIVGTANDVLRRRVISKYIKKNGVLGNIMSPDDLSLRQKNHQDFWAPQLHRFTRDELGVNKINDLDMLFHHFFSFTTICSCYIHE